MLSRGEERLRLNISQTYLDALKLILFLMFVFSIFSHTVGHNENSRFATTVGIVEDGSLSIERAMNSTGGDNAVFNSEIYSDKPPLPSLLAVPSYIVVDQFFPHSLNDRPYSEDYTRNFDPKMEWGRFAATVSVSALAGSLTSVLIYFLSLNMGLDRWRSISIAVFAALGTLIFPYSTTFHGSMLATFFVLLATYIWVIDDFEPSTKNSFFISFLLGLAISSDYITAFLGGLMIFIIFANSLKNLKLHFSILLGFILGLLPLFIFNYLTTGNPFLPTILINLVENTHTIEGGAQSLGDAPLISILYYLSNIFKGLFSFVNGLFFYVPILVFGIIGLRWLYKDYIKLFWFISLGFLASALLNFMTFSPVRAFFGPRYLLTASTLLLIPLALEIKSSGYLERILIYISGIWSLIVMLSSTQTWRGLTPDVDSVEYFREKIMLGSHENRLFDYLQGLDSEAFQSPVFSYLIGNVSEFHMVLTPYPDYSFPLTVFSDFLIVFDTRALIFSAIIFCFLILYGRDLGKSKHPLIPLLFVVSLGILILGGGIFTHYEHGWYEDTSDVQMWGKESSSIYFYSGTDEHKIFEMRHRSLENRDIDVSLNGNQVSEITSFEDEKKISKVLDVNKGINRLEFDSENCSVIGRTEVDTEDVRCVSIGVKDYNLTKIEQEYLYTSNLEADSRGYKSVENDSKIIFRGDGNYSLNLETVYEADSDDKTKDLSVYRDEKHYIDLIASQVPSKSHTERMDVQNLTKFEFRQICRDCDIYITDIEIQERKRVEGDYRLGHNWYNEIEHEDLTWGIDNQTLFIYNNESETLDTEINMRGRSFNGDKYEILMNGEVIAERRIDSYIDDIRLDVKLDPGENVLKIDNIEGCTKISEALGNDDPRCVSYGLKELEIAN